MKYFRFALLLSLYTFSTASGVCQEFDEKFEHWPIDHKIGGSILILNALKETTEADQEIIRLGGGKECQIVILHASTAASAEKDGGSPGETRFESAKSVRVLDIAAKWDSKLEEQLTEASVIYLAGSALPSDESLELLDPVEKHLRAVLMRRGVVVVDGDWARYLSRVVITGGKRHATVTEGLNLVPDTVIETRFSDSDDLLRVKSTLVSHPRTVGIGIQSNSSLILRGRKCYLTGEGTATFLLAANSRQPQREQTITSRKNRRDPSSFLVDLTEWRRDAIDRTLAPFPVEKPRPPIVEYGTLVIVGGGGMPKDLMSDFVEMAGGKENAKLVYIPCSEQDELPEKQRTVEMWSKMGVKNCTFIHTKDRIRANSDDEFLKPLTDATGIWFGGGRQWNFSDSYYGTRAHRLMKAVLKRGGVIGGSSAGASIQARYLARATPIGNFKIMAPGYERGGLGFLSGVAIDQHFSQRGRQKDMTQLMATHPQLLGIGLDEATAIIVQKSNAKVVGKGKAHFYDRKVPVIPGKPDFVALPKGSEYDLAERKVRLDTTPKQEIAEEPDKKTVPKSGETKTEKNRKTD